MNSLKNSFIVLFVLITSTVFGQETMSDSLKALYSKLLDIQKIQATLKSEQEALGKSSEDLYKLIDNSPIEFPDYVEERQKKLLKLIVELQDFLEESSQSYSNIQTVLATSSYLSELNLLNNASNEDLGSSVETILQKLIEEHIVKDMPDKDADRVNSFVNTILKNPLTKSLTNAVPVLGNVVNFITSISFGNNKVHQDKIESFIEAVRKYNGFYEELNSTNIFLQDGLNNLSIRNDALQATLRSFIIEMYVSLGNEYFYIEYSEIGDEITINELVSDRYFSEAVVDDYIEEMKKLIDGRDENAEWLSTVSLFNSLERAFPDYTLNNCLFHKDEISALVSDYNLLLDEHYSKLSKVLKTSAENLEFIKEDKVTNTLTKLELSKNKVTSSFKSSSGVDRVTREYKQLSDLDSGTKTF